MNELQLQDYETGYRFRLKCACGYGWYEEPAELLDHPLTHSRMYIDELEHLLTCRACRRVSQAKITVILIKPQHHFVGGLA